VTPFNQAIPFNQNQNIAFNSINLKSQFKDPSLTRTLVFVFSSVNLRSQSYDPINKNQNIAFNSLNLKSQSWNIIPFLVLLWFAKNMEENEWYGGGLDWSLPLARTNHRLLRNQPSTPKNKPQHNNPAIINNNT